MGHHCDVRQGWPAQQITHSHREKGVTMMRPSTKDQLEGTLHEVKGAIKESAGHLVGNPGLEAEGSVEKTAGKAQQKLAQVKKVLEP
jgi:uncharacterized protein YjbJ (UPF0337 family)